MSESTTPAQCRDTDWTLARDCGLLAATPGTNAWDAALGRFADSVRSALSQPQSQAHGEAVLVNRGALQVAINMLRRDAEEGQAVRGEAADELSLAAPVAAQQGLSEDDWIALAERHANADWNSEKPDGYLNAVKALVRDALSRATPAKSADRAMLEAVSQDLEISTWQCERCGHAEDCKTMDAAYMLRDYLGAAASTQQSERACSGREWWLHALPGAEPAGDCGPSEPSAGRDGDDDDTRPVPPVEWDRFPGWLIDHHEGETITEELLQHALADMLKVFPATHASSTDSAAARDAELLEKAARVPREYAEELDRQGWGNRFPDELAAIFNASTNMASMIRALAAKRVTKGAPDAE